MLLSNAHVSRLHKAFSYGSSTNIKLSKTQLHKIGQSGGFLGRLLELLLIGNVLKLLAKVLIPLGSAAASAADAAIHKKMFGSGTRPSDFAKQTISNEEMNDITKIVKSLEVSGLLIKGVSKTIKNEAKEQKGGFLGILSDTLGNSLLENLLTGKVTIRAGEGTIRAGQNFNAASSFN